MASTARRVRPEPPQSIPISQWVVANLIGITMCTLVAFVLYTNLWLTRYSELKDGFTLLSNLILCGAAQGLMFASLQTIVLLSTKSEVSYKVSHWIGSTIICMVVGMTLPMVYAVFSPDSSLIDALGDYVIAGWGLSWVLAGLFWGAIAGQTKTQKFQWSLLNAGAYFFWGIAATFGWRLLVAAMDSSTRLASIIGGEIGLVIVVMLGIGIGLNSLIFRGLIHDQGRPKHRV